MDYKFTLKNDILFKALFGKEGNEGYLKHFLEALLGIIIYKIEIITEYTLKQLSTQEKGGRIDVLAKINDNIYVNIELQIRDEKNIEERTLYYASRLLTEKSQKGEKYEELDTVIMINILDYELLDYNEFVSDTVTVINKHREYETIKNQKFYYIELPKFRKSNIDINDELNQWLALIDNNEEVIKMAMAKNETIRKAKKELDKLTADPSIRGLIKLRDKWERDYANGIACAKDEGREIGEKLGKRIGEELGKEIGKEIGKEEGRNNAKEEMAKEMLKNNEKDEKIIKYTLNILILVKKT